MQVWHSNLDIMPSQRKRIGFLPSQEVHEIIEKICKANKYSQSKVTGLLVEEALRSRGVLSDSLNLKTKQNYLINDSFEQVHSSHYDNSASNNDVYYVNKKELTNNIKMMHEFVEFKYFKKVMKRNNNINE